MAGLFRQHTVRYTLPDGKTRTPDGKRVTRDTPGAVRKNEKSKNYYGQVKNPVTGEWERFSLGSNKQVAQELLCKMVIDARRQRLGLADPMADHRQRPLLDHLEDYRRYLEGKGNCPAHVEKTCSQVGAVISGCGWEAMHYIDESDVVEFLAGLRQSEPAPALPPRKESFTAREVAALLGITPVAVGRMARRRLLPCSGAGRKRLFGRGDVEQLVESHTRGIGISTSNHYLVAMKGFSKWLFKNRVEDPLAHLARQNAQVDIRRERRSLTSGEFARLASAAENGLPFRGLTGHDRAILYALAAHTGLRANELGSLTPESFAFETVPATVTIRAAYSKHRRKDPQMLRPDVAKMMRDYLENKPAAAPLWPGSWIANAAEMLRLDLQGAGIPYVQGGACFDFHGLRHVFVSWLAEADVHPALAKELARHSTIELTMNAYTHPELRSQAAALEKLPALPKSLKPKLPARACG
jgi:integrase